MQNTVQRRQHMLLPDDVLWNTTWTVLDDSLAVLTQVKSQLMTTDADAITSALCQFPCQICNKHFPSSVSCKLIKTPAACT